MRTRPSLLFLPLLLVLLCALLAPRGCVLEGEGELYLLGEDSAMLDGCFGTCRCPVRLRELTGSLRLTELPILSPGPNRAFRVNEVRWRAGSGDDALEIRGGGLYELDPQAGSHRLLLRLSLAGAPLVEYDSGVQPGGDGFPALAIRVSENGEVACFDTVFELRAAPVPDPEPDCLVSKNCADGELCVTPTGQCEAAGACLWRPDACLTVYDPVCGCDGRSYGNACEALRNGVSVASEGPCADLGCRENLECGDGEYCARPPGACDAVGECRPRPDACLQVYDPVCGCDARTHGNACDAASSGTSVASEGVCAGA